MAVADKRGYDPLLECLAIFARLYHQPVSIEGQGRPLLIDEFLDLEQPYPLRQLCAIVDYRYARFDQER